MVPDQRHFITRNDLVNDNADLFAAAGALLAALPVRQLHVQAVPAAGNTVKVTVTTQQLDRVDAFVNRRPVVSVDLGGSSTTFTIAKPSAGTAELRLEAYSGGVLAANRLLTI